MHPGLPICLADEVVLGRRLERDEPVMLADVEFETDRFDHALYGRALEASAALAEPT